MLKNVLVESREGWGELVLNRPKQRNSLTGPLVSELIAGLRQLENDDHCKAIIIRGAESYFCAGLDVKAFFSEPKPDWVADFGEHWLDFHAALFDCPVPVIGALEGFAIAGGSALALACDFLVAGENSFLHVSEVERGMPAPINIAWLELNYGRKKALELAVLGEKIYGPQLLAKGLVIKCVKDGEVVSEVRELATRFANLDAKTVSKLKAGIRHATLARGQNFRDLVAAIKKD